MLMVELHLKTDWYRLQSTENVRLNPLTNLAFHVRFHVSMRVLDKSYISTAVSAVALTSVVVVCATAWIARLREVRRLEAIVENLKSRGAAAQYNRQAGLLTARGDSLCDDDLASLCNCGRYLLRCVEIADSSITDDGFVHFRECSNLESISVSGSPITGSGARYLGELHSLHRLALHDTDIDDDGMSYICKLTRLQSLSLTRTRISDKGACRISALRNLESLYLYDTNVSDISMEAITKCVLLQELNVGRTNISDAGAFQIATLKSIRTIYIKDTRVTDVGILSFRTMPALSRVDAFGTRITKTTIEALRSTIPGINIGSDCD